MLIAPKQAWCQGQSGHDPLNFFRKGSASVKTALAEIIYCALTSAFLFLSVCAVNTVWAAHFDAWLPSSVNTMLQHHESLIGNIACLYHCKRTAEVKDIISQQRNSAPLWLKFRCILTFNFTYLLDVGSLQRFLGNKLTCLKLTVFSN